MTEQHGSGSHWPLPDEQGSSESPPSSEASGADQNAGATGPQEAELPEVPPGALESGRTVIFGAHRRPTTPPSTPDPDPDPGTPVAGGSETPSSEPGGFAPPSGPPPYGSEQARVRLAGLTSAAR